MGEWTGVGLVGSMRLVLNTDMNDVVAETNDVNHTDHRDDSEDGEHERESGGGRNRKP